MNEPRFETFVVILIMYNLIYRFVLLPTLYRMLSKLPNWNELKDQPATFGNTSQDEILYLLLVGFHHSIAGFLMVSNNTNIFFVYGLYLELAFEISDIFNMITSQFPHVSKQDGTRNWTLIRLLVAHHSTGLLLSFPILRLGIYQQTRSLGWIAGSYELGGAFGILFSCFEHTRDMKTQKHQIYVAEILSLSLFIFIRFVLTPSMVLEFFAFVYVHCSVFVTIGLILGSIPLFSFNVLCIRLKMKKILKLRKEIAQEELEVKPDSKQALKVMLSTIPECHRLLRSTSSSNSSSSGATKLLLQKRQR